MTTFLPQLAGLLLLVAPSLHADEAEDKAVAAVGALGGTVWRDDMDPAHPVVIVTIICPPVRRPAGLSLPAVCLFSA